MLLLVQHLQLLLLLHSHLSSGQVTAFTYTGSPQQFVPSLASEYKIELWGGGSTGKGAYTSGKIRLNTANKLYIYVGGEGKQACLYGTGGGWNGGASPSSSGYFIRLELAPYAGMLQSS